MFVRRLEQFLIFVSPKEWLLWLMLIIYTFNNKCQKSSKSHASFFILKVSIMILLF